MLARPQLSSMQLAAQFVRDEGPFRSCRIHIRRGISIEMLIQCVESGMVYYIIIFIALFVKPEADPAGGRPCLALGILECGKYCWRAGRGGCAE